MVDFFIEGLLHPLLTPSHLMVLIALGLLAGQQGWGHIKTAIPVFVLAVLGGVGLTLVTTLKLDFYIVLLAIALVAGLLTVVNLRLPMWLLMTLAAIAALVVGLDSAAPRIPGLRGERVHALLAGTALSASLVVVCSGALGAALRNLLEGIPVRVLGAWITAGALLVLVLKLTKTVL